MCYNPTVQEVRNLREITGAGMMDCKKALKNTNGNVKDAITYLKNSSNFNRIR